MPVRVTITGGGGFVGQWLARRFLARGDAICLAGLGEIRDQPRILAAAEWTGAHWTSTDVRDEQAVTSLIQASRPDVLIHLAALSFVPQAEANPELAEDINVGGARRLLRAVATLRARGDIDPVILVVGSATQYGLHDPAEMPLDEAAELRPQNVYASTKMAQERESLASGRESGLRVICVRSFNHSGIGHDAAFFLPSLIRRVRELPKNSGILRIGNDVIRDYLHVDDVVEAYVGLIERGSAGEVYNVCSGVGVSTSQLARDVISRSGVDARVESDPALQRAGDMPILVGSPSKLQRATGWSPRKTHHDIIDDLFRSV